MNKIDFINEAKNRIEKLISNDYDVFIQEIVKPNKTYTGICARKVGSNLTAAIDPTEYFFNYEHSAISFDAVCKEIIKSLTTTPHPAVGDIQNLLLNWNKAEGRLYAAVRKEVPDKFLQKEFLDLKFVPYVNISTSSEGVASIPVTKELVETWGKTEEEVIRAALDNNMIFFTPEIKTIYEALGMPESSTEPAMYYIQNKTSGAGSAFNKTLYETLSRKFGGDFYYLPSSIHEMIAIPVNEEIDINSMRDIVREINTTLAPNEVLGESIYRYNSETKEMTVVEYVSTSDN